MKQLWENYKTLTPQIKGFYVGLAIGIIILILGLFKTLFIAFCSCLGYYVGKRITLDKKYFTDLLDRVLPPGMFR